jgi:hypothetical protein
VRWIPLRLFSGLIATTTAVVAAPTPPGQASDRESVRLVVRGVGEAWQDPSLTRIYRNSLLSGGVGIVIPLHTYLALDVEAIYKRQAGMEVFAEDGDDSAIPSAFEIVPLTLSVEGRLPTVGGGELFLGVGPTLTVFTEEHSIRTDNGQVATQGMKINMDTRFGVRMDTGLVRPSMVPVGTREIQGVDLELFIGRRWQFGEKGFDLSAWRGGFGFAFRM